jgi:small subunit ribosomal protein S1
MSTLIMSPSEPTRGAGDTFADLFAQHPDAPARQRRLAVGDPIEVTIVKVTRDAVFADIDGKREAYIDASDLLDGSGRAIEVQVGARVSARVAELGGRAGAMRLTPLAVQQSLPEPSEDGDIEPEAVQRVDLRPGAGAPLVTGARVKGTVTRIETYGVFVQIEGTTGRGGRGLLPAAESNLPRGADLRRAFAIGQAVETKIVAIDESGKIRLSVRALEADQEREQYDELVRARAGKEASSAAGFGTLGDLLAKRPPAKPKKR